MQVEAWPLAMQNRRRTEEGYEANRPSTSAGHNTLLCGSCCPGWAAPTLASSTTTDCAKSCRTLWKALLHSVTEVPSTSAEWWASGSAPQHSDHPLRRREGWIVPTPAPSSGPGWFCPSAQHSDGSGTGAGDRPGIFSIPLSFLALFYRILSTLSLSSLILSSFISYRLLNYPMPLKYQLWYFSALEVSFVSAAYLPRDFNSLFFYIIIFYSSFLTSFHSLWPYIPPFPLDSSSGILTSLLC